MRIFPLLIFAILAGAAARGFQTRWNTTNDHSTPSNPTLWRLVATPGPDRAAWITAHDDSAWQAWALITLPDGRIVRQSIRNRLPQDPDAAINRLSPQWLAELPLARSSDSESPDSESPDSESPDNDLPTDQPTDPISDFRILVWDPLAAVYITGGPDGQPGIAGHDDNLNGVIDDLAELGSTGSDDLIASPGHPDFDAATNGQIAARLLSHGAAVPLDERTEFDTGPLRATTRQAERLESTAVEVWIELSHGPATPPVTLLLESPAATPPPS